MKYHPSPLFLKIVIPAAVLAAGLWYGVLPDFLEAQKRPSPGVIAFSDRRPDLIAETDTPGKNSPSTSTTAFSDFSDTTDWFGEQFEKLMEWDKNPWRKSRQYPGAHFQKMLGSSDPVELARAREIQRLAEATLKRLMERYPELAVQPNNIPDERNAFLKWLDFSDRMEALAPEGKLASLPFSEQVRAYLKNESSWDPAAVREWLTTHAPLIDEIRTIGLMEDSSTTGIPVDRYALISTRLAKDSADILMMEARLAAEQGDAASAMRAIMAARGLADHFIDVESPTILAATVTTLIQLEVEKRTLTEIIPALPAHTRDIAAWEKAVNPVVRPPAEFARLMAGEWSVALRQWILPPILDAGEPKSPTDPAALLDAYSTPFAKIVQTHQTATWENPPALPFSSSASGAGLSRDSREIVENTLSGVSSWSGGFLRAQHVHGINQAAFAIMKGENVPLDPIGRKPYQWDPTTRTLSMPVGELYDSQKVDPIIVP